VGIKKGLCKAAVASGLKNTDANFSEYAKKNYNFICDWIFMPAYIVGRRAIIVSTKSDCT
jgi:hypothetical protein